MGCFDGKRLILVWKQTGLWAVLIGSSPLLSGCFLTRYEVYATYDDAKLDGAFERGWLPEWLPQSASEIHEAHDLDSNQRAFSFRLPDHVKFMFPEICGLSDDVLKPRMRTKMFPDGIESLRGIQACKRLFVVVGPSGMIHAWGR